jgi:6-phosphofructokinase 1
VILIPEIPFNLEQVVRKIHDRNSKGKHFSIIVVAEGAKPEGGSLTISQVITDSPDPVRLGGIGGQVASELEQLTGMETRVTVLGHLQRGGRPSPYDRILATRYGVAAVNLVADERYGCMVSLAGSGITAVNLAEAVGGLKNVSPTGQLIQTARDIGIEFGN